MKPFDYSLDYANLDLRAHPELYAVGRGEQGVLMVEPYKSEILPHWRFKTPEEALESSEKIHAMFLAYKAADDFIGMDMARKFLQMGFTRARRYANHKSGRKYAAAGGEKLPDRYDPVKAKSATIFKKKWDEARTDPDYLKMKRRHRERYEGTEP
ncbi:DUF4385 domain-containing protein [Cohnella sp. GCM10012308]|uniref:DUF4385 domain-containing protein n=1 Tax=Cohnella sp. GCM10012308 TaxID=3317329 RepID=UPI003615D6EC